MLNIPDPDSNNRVVPLFRLAFRPFFLGAAVFSLVTLALWGMFWLTGLSWSPYGGWIWWHMHEMLFGFTVAIIVGFLLTAIQNWTGQPSISGWPLFALFCLWLTPRFLLLFSIGGMTLLPWIDVSFLVVSSAIMAFLVIRSGQKQQLIFVGLLLLLAFSNAQMHWAIMSGSGLLARTASHGGLFLIVLMIVVMGGRVIPFFTSNGTNTHRKDPIPLVERLSLLTVAVLALLNITGWVDEISSLMLGLIFILTGVVNLIRFLSWRPWITFNIPLLWSLHLAYLIIVIGFFLAGFHFIFLATAFSNLLTLNYPTILHSFTVGGMGLLIMAMMARVSLGHTGRQLTVGTWMSISFLSITGAYVCRVLLPIFIPSASHYWSYLLSIAFWLLGYGIFVALYLPILTRARVDGNPG